MQGKRPEIEGIILRVRGVSEDESERVKCNVGRFAGEICVTATIGCEQGSSPVIRGLQNWLDG